MIDQARLVKKAGNYAISTSGAVSDHVLMEIASQYQTNVAGKFVAMKPDDLPRRYTGGEDVLASVKYDGEGVFIYFESGKMPFEVIIFNAPSGRARVGLPVAEALASQLTGKGVKKALLRAELYLPSSEDGRRNSSSDVARASFSTEASEHARFHLAVFDIVMIDGEDWRPHQNNYRKVWDKLGELAGSDVSKSVHRVQGDIVKESTVAGYFASHVKAGSEGLVIRRLARPEVSKVKPHLTFDTVVIGFVVTDVEGEPGVASVLTALVYPGSPSGKLAVQVFARVGSGMDDAYRKSLLAQLQPAAVGAPLAMTDSDGRPVVFVMPQHVLEIEADDVLGAVKTSVEKENTTQFMSWDGKVWSYHRQAVCPRVSFPIFGKLRSDKTIEGGASIAQLIANPVLPPLEAANKAAAPSIVRREVYRKDGKSGDVAVRKLVVAKKHDPDSFPFIIYWTDYSSKRKDPLKVTTQYASTAERAEALASALVEEGVTKGFVRAG